MQKLRVPNRAIAALPFALLAGCAGMPPEVPGPPAKEEIVAVTASNHLLRFNAGQPQNVRERKPLTGLPAGEKILGIDYRVAYGKLFALGASGQLYRIDTLSATATAIGSPAALPAVPPTEGTSWGFDFNPAVDRIRVVSGAGSNLRLHPETGSVIDSDAKLPGIQFDGRLAYDAADAQAGRTPAVVAAAYTYNKSNDKLTTNYALDGALGNLVHQGTKEGVAPAVSPNTGRLFTVGHLGIGRFEHATFDISDVTNTAYAGVHDNGARATRWYGLDLATGKARFIGTVGGGETLAGAAIEP